MSYEAWGDGEDQYWTADRLSEEGWISPDDYSKAAIDVLNERVRQQEGEGWTPEHDDTHETGELALAAACYAAGPDPLFRAEERCGRDYRPFVAYMPIWPWVHSWWKPKDKRADLVRAGALILAEIERLDRAAAKVS